MEAQLEEKAMLHIVQVVLSGNAEAPQVFLTEEAARAAFVDCAKKYWAQAYASFCERSGLDNTCFSSAQAFVATFDLADRSRIHYWSVALEGGPAGDLSAVAALKGEGERIGRMVRDLEQAAGSLLETIAGLTGDDTVAAPRPAGEPDAPRPLAPPEPAAAPATAQLPELYGTREWKEYVETIKNMCGGSRSEFHLFTRHDWRQAVYGEQTPFEYWEWVAATIDHYIEKAQQAGYSIIPDPEKAGRYRFRTPDGVVSDIATEAEGEAWCRAGLHLEPRRAG